MIGIQIIRLATVNSTNNYANGQLVENELPDGTVFLAYEQSAGRGQMNNFWESEPGKNLTFSIVVYPDFLDIRCQFMLSKVVTLGIYHALDKYVDDLRIKWPNDIYADRKFHHVQLNKKFGDWDRNQCESNHFQEQCSQSCLIENTDKSAIRL